MKRNLKIFIAAFIIFICITSCSNNETDTAYALGFKNNISKGSDSYITVSNVEKAFLLSTPDKNEYKCDEGKKYLILTIEFDLSETDYTLSDIVKVSGCFDNNDDHTYDEELTEKMNESIIKDSQIKRGNIRVVDIVNEDFEAEYMPIGIVDNRGIDKRVKYIIE